jgi:hypothetical protein
MMRSFEVLFLASIVLTAPVVLLAQDSDQTSAETQAAEAAFPQELRYAGKPPFENPYHTCAAVLSRNADGTPDSIAAGYSGDGAKVAILKNEAAGAKIISDIANEQFLPTDGECDLQLVNLADPRHPDSPLANAIDVSFDDGPDWFFTWDGKNLQNITALQAEMGMWRWRKAPASNMYSANVVDIDHHGPMQIAGNNGDGDKFADNDGIAATPTLTVFRIDGNRYKAGNILQFLDEYTPNVPHSSDDQAAYKADGARWTTALNMHRTPAPNYELRVINGDRDGGNRVSSVKVEINGVTIVLPNEVNQGVETLTRTIQLRKENLIKVTVDGPEKSHLYVTVQ